MAGASVLTQAVVFGDARGSLAQRRDSVGAGPGEVLALAGIWLLFGATVYTAMLQLALSRAKADWPTLSGLAAVQDEQAITQPEAGNWRNLFRPNPESSHGRRRRIPFAIPGVYRAASA